MLGENEEGPWNPSQKATSFLKMFFALNKALLLFSCLLDQTLSLLWLPADQTF